MNCFTTPAHLAVNVTKLKTFLKEYLPAMDETIPTLIGRGGCGLFAAKFSDVLTGMGVEHKIIALYESGNRDWVYMQAKVDGKPVPVEHMAVGHCVIQLGKDYFDSDGIMVDESCFHEDNGGHKIEITIDILKSFLGNNNWNHDFDRKLVPAIDKYLTDIPAKFASWKGKGEYKHKYDARAVFNGKPLNQYTKNMIQRDGFFGII